jgi:rhodanese-related sulfurtransferase/DNA-binding MarR family transcriptional regulator
MAMTDRAAKTRLYEQFARVGKALASPARLELLDLLAQGERGVEDLAGAAGLRLSNASAQLQVLASAGLAASRRSGRRVYYRLADDAAGLLAGQVQQFACEQLAEAERAAGGYLGDVAALEPVSREELSRRIQAGSVLVLDVRPVTEYAAGHIPGAMSIPHDELSGRLSELPASTEIVAYCRGRYCVMAPEAVRILRRHGWRARPLEDGLPEWRRAGLPVTSAAALSAGGDNHRRRPRDEERTLRQRQP